MRSSSLLNLLNMLMATVAMYFNALPRHVTCKAKARGVQRFLDTGDAKSTGNMQKHARKCWGNKMVAAADKANNANYVCATTVKGALNPQSIMAVIERKGKGKVTYSHQQHSKTEARCIHELEGVAVWLT